MEAELSKQPLRAAIPCILAVAGIVAGASESSAAGRRHAALSAKAHWHHPLAAHAAHGLTPHDFVHRWSRNIAHHGANHLATDATSRRVRHADHEATADSGHSFSGFASYYSEGQHVASGGGFKASGLTCAHRSLPFGTHLRVADPRSGRSVVVTVNDRGPFVRERVLDLSLGAARALGMTGRGVTRITASVI